MKPQSKKYRIDNCSIAEEYLVLDRGSTVFSTLNFKNNVSTLKNMLQKTLSEHFNKDINISELGVFDCYQHQWSRNDILVNTCGKKRHPLKMKKIFFPPFFHSWSFFKKSGISIKLEFHL